jgi:exonuclease III
LSEHHLNDIKLQLIQLNHYSLGAKYCRKQFLKGGVSIFVRSNLNFETVNLEEYIVEKDIEVCAIQLIFNLTMRGKFCIMNVYRSPVGNFTNFLEKLDMILQKLFKERCNMIICGDINVNYLNEDNKKRQLDIVLQSYNLTSIVTFPTRVDMSSCTLIDNLFFYIASIGKYDT